MKAKEVHDVLKVQLAEACTASGFARLPRTMSAWYKREGDDFLIFRIHLSSKFGYTTSWGGCMLLRGWRAKSLEPQPERGVPHTPMRLFPEPLLRKVKELNDQVTAKILAGDWAPLLRTLDNRGPALVEGIRAHLQRALATPYHPGMFQDQMAYLDAEDITTWSALLAEAVPHIATSLAAVEL